MRKLPSIACYLLLPAVALVVGCSAALVGSWKTEPMPQGEPFVITNATFKDDNTYSANAKEGEQNVRLAGTYDYNGFNLKLKTPGKPDRQYGATVNTMMKTLELRSDGKKVTMKKQ